MKNGPHRSTAADISRFLDWTSHAYVHMSRSRTTAHHTWSNKITLIFLPQVPHTEIQSDCVWEKVPTLCLEVNSIQFNSIQFELGIGEEITSDSWFVMWVICNKNYVSQWIQRDELFHRWVLGFMVLQFIGEPFLLWDRQSLHGRFFQFIWIKATCS